MAVTRPLSSDLKSVLGTLAHNRSFTVGELREYLHFARMSGSARVDGVSANSLMRHLVKIGYVRRLEKRGHYAPTSAGWAWIEGRSGDLRRTRSR